MDADFTDSGRAARVRALAPAIDALFADALSELGAPGIAYGVALDGELVHAGGCGARDLDSGTAPDADTAFRICSMTKSFVAMTVLSLRDEGRLDIDAPLGDVVEECAAGRGRAGRAARDRAPAAHDGRRPAAGRPLGGSPHGPRPRVGHRVALLARRHPLARARHLLRVLQLQLGRARASRRDRHGQRHQDVVRERVLDPLALTLDRLERRRSACSSGSRPGYRPAGEGFTAEVPLADGGDFAALGGLYSTVRDLARWSGVFLGAEPPRDAPEGAPVSRATLREMQRARSAFAPGVEWQSLAEPPGVIAGATATG